MQTNMQYKLQIASKMAIKKYNLERLIMAANTNKKLAHITPIPA